VSTLTVKGLAERYGVTEHTVLSWIRSGELRAINVGRHQGAGKPRWRITAQAVEAFELLRTPTPPVPRTRRRRRAAPLAMEFIK